MNANYIIKPFNECKCEKCNKDGFIIIENSAVKCDCRKKYEDEMRTCDKLLKSGLLNENSNYEDFKKLYDYEFIQYKGIDENGNIKRIQKFVDEFDKVKYKEVPHNILDDNGNVIRTEYSKISVGNPFKSLHCYVYGEQGTQKSTVLKGMLTKLAKKGKEVYYIFCKDLIDIIIDSDRDENAKKLLDYIINVDVLVIDEFEEQRTNLWQSGYKERSLIVWIKNRLEVSRKSTWFVSNATIEEMKNGKFGELFGDVIERETLYGRFEFKDKYVNSLSKQDIAEKMKFIWDD